MIAQTIWICANTVSGPLRDQLVVSTRPLGTEPPGAGERLNIRLAHDALGRLVAAESLAAGLLRHPADEVVRPSTLTTSVAEWDVQAHRTLLTNRSTVAMTLIAANEASVQRGFAAVVDRAGATQAIDAHTVERLRPSLDALASAWSGLADETRELMWGAQSVPSQTVEAADDLRHSFADLDLLSLSPDGHRELLHTFDSHLSSSLALAVAARELIHDGELRAPARAVNAVLMERRPDLDHAPVSPLDMAQGRSVSLPSEMRDVLAASADRICHESLEAVGRASSLGVVQPSVVAMPPSPVRSPAVQMPGFGLTARPLGPLL